ncbi:MAG TPA: hypothetical protein ENO30_07125 [Thermodesulfobium narugense]|uniref:Uncharacterized protein n=1 Tax=Thermodesulfobium acidiphilum TaxID=1794699 RepID=A0A2R4VZP3_THEAF|nr:hypothetical protein [Thermodesulfobium acidiphilum]AWB10009.1 hypothetical protein TDSAC_0636 [Thermodesulfobium acidiphilum]PMP86088.1 MAG: hypothetical protein C0174_02480 [Thermodesulfobium narugense]HEM56511.1 hypothetical protein [Thermodesulfobium narugense]
MSNYIRDKSFYFLHKDKYGVLGYKAFFNNLKNQFENSEFYRIKSITHTSLGKVNVIFYIPDYLIKTNSDKNFYDLNGNVVSGENLKNKKFIFVNSIIKNSEFFDMLQNIVYYSTLYGFTPDYIFFYDDIIKFKDKSTTVFEFKNDGKFDEKFRNIFDFLENLNNKNWPKEIILLDERRLVVKK